VLKSSYIAFFNSRRSYLLPYRLFEDNACEILIKGKHQDITYQRLRNISSCIVCFIRTKHIIFNSILNRFASYLDTWFSLFLDLYITYNVKNNLSFLLFLSSIFSSFLLFIFFLLFFFLVIHKRDQDDIVTKINNTDFSGILIEYWYISKEEQTHRKDTE